MRLWGPMGCGIKLMAASAMLAAACAHAGPRPDYFVAAKSAPSIRIDHEVAPAELKQLHIQPVIVPTERMAEVGGVELLAEARAAFIRQREGRIAVAGSQSASGPIRADLGGDDAARLALTCVVNPLFCVLLPVTLPLAFAAASVHDAGKRAVKRNRADRREAKLVIPENEAARLLSVIEARANTAVLAERAAAHALPVDLSDVHGRLWLVVGLESINVNTLRDGRVVMRITAEAQAIAPSGTVFAPTKHVYEWTRWSPAEWTAGDSALLEQALEPALEALAQGIAFAYTPSFSLEEQEEELVDARSKLTELFPPPMPRPLAATSAFPAADALTDPRLPQRGDSWSYRLTIPEKGADRLLHVTVLSASSSGIEEQVAASGERVVRIRHVKGAYLTRDGGLLAFSPYLPALDALDSIDSSLASARIESRDGCDPEWLCSASLRVLGDERLRALGAEIETTKVEVVQAWTPRFQNGQSGHQTLTLWYAPQFKRVVKVSSRGPRSLVVETNFDLELESYQLN